MGRRVASEAGGAGSGNPGVGELPARSGPRHRRSAERSNGKADRVLAGIVFIAGDKVLLVLSRKDEEEYNGRWSFPKGKYQENIDEGLFAAAARELKEET